MMVMETSLRRQMLRLIAIQGAFFLVAFTAIWAINPNWIFWHKERDPAITQSLHDFKYHYGMLNALNLRIAQQRYALNTAREEFNAINGQLHDSIQAIKQSSLTAQQYFELDFTVLVHFLFHYKNKVTKLDPKSPSYEENLWNTTLYFSRIQREFFYISEEIDRKDAKEAIEQLKNAKQSLLIWLLTCLGIFLVGIIVSVNYARAWKAQIAQLLIQIYRISADDYSGKSQVHTKDELGFVATALNQAIIRVKERCNRQHYRPTKTEE